MAYTMRDSGNQMSLYDFDKSNHLKVTKPIRLIELFAGIGAQAKALENLGANFEHYRICEFDKYAVASYNAVHGTNFQTSDITKIHAEDLGIQDTKNFTYIMTYSFPCQDLSKAGNQKGMRKGGGTRSGLLWEVERILREIDGGKMELPQILLMENVPDVISEKNAMDFTLWCEFLESLGYTNKYALLNSKNFGVPQNRERCFMLSWLGDYTYQFPVGYPLKKRLKDVLETEVEEKYYQGIIEPLPFELSNRMKAYINSKNNKYKVGEGNLVINRSVAQSITTREGSSRADTSCFLCHDFCENKNIAGIDMRPFRVRKLTPKECWRLMGFADEDVDKAKEKVSNSQLYKQAGNSIVVDVLMAIFKNLLYGERK